MSDKGLIYREYKLKIKDLDTFSFPEEVRKHDIITIILEEKNIYFEARVYINLKIVDVDFNSLYIHFDRVELFAKFVRKIKEWSEKVNE